MKKFIPAISLALVGAFTFTGCETTGQSALAGAATGAAIGAAGGALLGHAARQERERGYDEGYYDSGSRGSRYRESRDYGERYPVGSRTGRYGLVRSPFSPGNLIDVSGIPRGAKVVDPSCDRVFINP